MYLLTGFSPIPYRAEKQDLVFTLGSPRASHGDLQELIVSTSRYILYLLRIYFSYSITMKPAVLLALLPSLSLSKDIQLRIPQTCRTTSGDSCIFPFTFKGQTFTKCTYTNSPTPWCATMVDQIGNVITNRLVNEIKSSFQDMFSLGGETVIPLEGFPLVKLTPDPLLYLHASQKEVQHPIDPVSSHSNTMGVHTQHAPMFL